MAAQSPQFQHYQQQYALKGAMGPVSQGARGPNGRNSNAKQQFCKYSLPH